MASARPSRRTPSRTGATLALSALSVVALAGCSVYNPITTAEAYNVVDGVQADLGGDVAARNLLVVTGGEGEAGAMSGALANQSREDVEVELSFEGAGSQTIEVAAGSTVLLGDEVGEEVAIDSVEAAPGSLLTVTASTPGGGSVEIAVPVFDGTLPEYAELVPDEG